VRCVVIGLGIQGQKRRAIAGPDLVATVDPVESCATYRRIEEVPLDGYEAALVCTPDQAKIALVQYLLSHGKHVLVEKPLVGDPETLTGLASQAERHRVSCYTAYNHRFEPNIRRLKLLLEQQVLGDIYVAQLFYGNGTAQDVRRSPWRDRGSGVRADLGSHLLDLVLYLWGKPGQRFESWGDSRFETRACDYCSFGIPGKPRLELTTTLVSWRNTFRMDVIGSRGSAHIEGLCKWGPSSLTLRRRVLPSGRPHEETWTEPEGDRTFLMEYDHFKQLCASRGSNIANDLWISSVLGDLSRETSERASA
jgi:predicted dehydrogenase